MTKRAETMTTEEDDYFQQINVGMWLRSEMTVDECAFELIGKGWHREDALDLIEETQEILRWKEDWEFLQEVRERYQTTLSVADQLDNGYTAEDCIEELLQEGVDGEDIKDVLIAAKILVGEASSVEKAQERFKSENQKQNLILVVIFGGPLALILLVLRLFVECGLTD